MALPNFLLFLIAMLQSKYNIQIIRTFVAMRQWIMAPPIDKNTQLQREVKELKEYIENVFTDPNDINEDTRMQLELINQTLAELQVKNKEQEKNNVPESDS